MDNKNDCVDKDAMQKILYAGQKMLDRSDDKTYKCLIGLRKPSETVQINFNDHVQSINKALCAYNEVSKDTSVKLLRVDKEAVAFKIITSKKLIGKDDFYFTCLNYIGASLKLLGMQKYSESTNGLLSILEIEEMTVNKVVDDKSNTINIEELIKKIRLLNELIVMGLDEDGSRAVAITEILDTVNNVLL